MGSMTVSEVISRILAFCGGLTIIGGAVAVIRHWMNPAFRLRKRVDTLEQKNREQEERNKDIKEMLSEIKQTNKLLCKSMMVLLDHSITGNGVENIKQVRSDLVQYLTEK
jgi:hypothetical protein